MKYYLGLDNGGTTTKAAIFSVDGEQLCSASVSTAMITPRADFVERDMEEMWQANCKVCRDALNAGGIDPADIAGVGICGHGKGLYLWGKDNRPARNGIISTDNRAYSYVGKWKADGTEKKVFDLSCQHIMACQPVALLAWLKDNEPETYSNIKWVFECKDYVRFRLTGEARAEKTDYSGANLMNLHSADYDKRLLELFGIEEIWDALPPLCESTEICGYVIEEAAKLCGLLPGTPVIGGMFDIDACALAVGIVDEKNVCMIAGTWSMNEYIRKDPVIDGSVMMNSFYALPGYYLVEESSPTSAGNSEWFIQQLLPELAADFAGCGKKLYSELNKWVEEIPPTEFVPIFLPFLMASNVHPNAKGSFVGLSTNHTRRHMTRSIYEGVAFCHRMHMERLMQSRQTPPSAIRLAGGAAKSRVWTQMFADILQLPIETVDAEETGALGCAVALAAATGAYANIEEAVKGMCRISEPVMPNRELKEIYDKKYDLYKKTIACLDGLWDDMQSLIEEA